ncbi:MAG: hypothetical protein IJV06_11410 [Bacteroidaceae bacterium]|nr:hypothetical protein [Bacteroidaceae bacterium]
MRRKFTNLLVLALALSSAGFVTSCKDTDEDTLAQNRQELINGYTDALNAQDASLKSLLAAQVKGLQDQIDAINTALGNIKQCSCADGALDERIQSLIDASITAALANNGNPYQTASDVATSITNAINEVIAKLSEAQKAEVEQMIKDYAAAHPGLSKQDVKDLIEGYLTSNPGLTKEDVETIVDAYMKAHPSLSKEDVQTIVTEWVYNHQILNKDEVNELIEAAITKALADYALKSDIPTQAYIESLIDKAINAYAATDKHLSEAEVQGMIDKAIAAAKAEWKDGITPAEAELLVTKAIQDALEKYEASHPAGMSAAEVALAINDAIKDLLNKDALSSYPTTAEVNNLINEALKGLKTDGLSESEVKELVNKIVTDALKGVDGLSEAEVKNLVYQIVDEKLKSYTTPNDVKALINDAVKTALAEYSTTDAVKNLINEAIAKALEGFNEGLTKAEVQNLITEAIKDVLKKSDLSAYSTTADVMSLIDDKVKDALEDYSTTAEIKNLIEAAKCACSTLTSEEVAEIASKVVADWAAAHPYPSALTAEDVENIAKNVVNDAQVIRELKDAKDALQNTLTEVQKDIAKLQEATSDLSTLKSDVAQNKVDIAKLQQAIEDLDLSNFVTKAVLAEELGKVNAAVEAAQAKADLAYNLAQAANEKFDKALEAINKVKTDLATIEGQLRSDITAAQKDATTALNNAAYNAQRIDDLDAVIHDILYKLGVLTGTVESLVPGEPVDYSDLIAKITIEIKKIYEGDLSKFATKDELNTAIANVTAAYKLADAAQNVAIAGLTTSVLGLEAQVLEITGQIADLKGQLATIDGKVKTLDGKVGTLDGKVTTLDGKVSTLEGQVGIVEGKVSTLEGKMTDAEGKISTLEGKMTEAEGKISTLEGKMTDAEGNISELQGKVSTLETKVETLDTKVEDYNTALNKAIDGIKEDITSLKKDVADNATAIGENKKAIDELTTAVDKIADALNSQITGVIVQGTYNPMYGTFNIPAGINSNVLVAYYGKADNSYEFPSSEKAFYADPAVTAMSKLTESDLDMIGSVDGQINGFAGTLISDTEDNAGKIYVTINPAGVDFSDAPIKLVNSQDEASGIELKNLDPSSKLITFGYTRAVSNGFYAADAHLSKSDISKVAVKIDRTKIANAFKDAFSAAKTAVKTKDVSGTFPSIATLVGTLYSQFNGILPALAVKAEYKNADGETRSVYSNYGVAATAVKAPGFSPDFWNAIEKKLLTKDEQYVRGYYSVMNIIYRINRRIDKFIKNTVNPRIKDNALVKMLDKAANDISNIDIIVVDGENVYNRQFVVYLKADALTTDIDPILDADGNALETKIIDGQKYIVVSFVADVRDILYDVNYDFNNTAVLVDDLADLFTKVNEYLGNLESYETRIENKIDNTIQKYLDKVNGKLVNFINNISDRVQPIALFVEGNKIAQLGGTRGAVKFVDASTITVYPTTYTAEVITPCLKKHVAVTNVYAIGASLTGAPESAQEGNGDCLAALQKANKGANMNKVINGGIHQNVTLNLEDGYIYEVAYSALDYNGQIATRKYYVAKK